MLINSNKQTKQIKMLDYKNGVSITELKEDKTVLFSIKVTETKAPEVAMLSLKSDCHAILKYP